jgi:hypothetical protein
MCDAGSRLRDTQTANEALLIIINAQRRTDKNDRTVA